MFFLYYKNKFIFKYLCIFLLLSLLSGCSLVKPPPIYEKNGKIYGWTNGNFLGQWDDYYKCGLSYMEGEFYQDALRCLNEAVKQRYQDQRRARTYGMHFVDDYFPHREKGVIYYAIGDYDKAKSELELSIRQEPSEKAYHFLDKVRRILMIKKKVIPSKPLVTITLPPGKSERTNEIRTNQDPIILSGVAEDEQYISEILISGKPIFIGFSEKHISFEKRLMLDQGKYEIDVVVRNLLDGQTEKKIIIYVDKSGPLIILTHANPDAEIRGYLYDESGVISLTANGETVSVPNGKDVPFSIQPKSGMKKMTLVAKDALGNQTKADIDTEMLAYHSSPLLASQNMADIGTDANTVFPNQNIKEPEIILKGLQNTENIFVEKVSVTGEVKSQNNIKSLMINDTPILHRKGNVIFFNHSLKPVPGKNIVRINATDEAGNRVVKEICIIRKIQSIYQFQYRYRLAMYPFENALQSKSGEIFQEIFLKHFTDRKRFQVLLREKSESAFEINESSSHSTFLGTLYETRDGLEIVARMVDNQTSEIIAVKDVYSDGKDYSAFVAMAERLTEKFHKEFPLIDDGMITKVSGAWKFWQSCPKFVTSFQNASVRRRLPLVVYDKDEPRCNPFTGESFGADTKVIGYDCIDGICNTLIDKQKPEIGHKVITQ